MLLIATFFDEVKSVVMDGKEFEKTDKSSLITLLYFWTSRKSTAGSKSKTVSTNVSLKVHFSVGIFLTEIIPVLTAKQDFEYKKF